MTPEERVAAILVDILPFGNPEALLELSEQIVDAVYDRPARQKSNPKRDHLRLVTANKDG